MNALKNILAIATLTIVIIALRFGLETWLMPEFSVHEQSSVTNISNPEGKGFKQGDTLGVELYFKGIDAHSPTKISITPEYSYRFGFKENSLTVDGQPFQGGELIIPAGGDPRLVRYEVIANGNTGDPRRLVTIQEEVLPTEISADTYHGTAQITACPNTEIIHNSDALLYLQGEGLTHGIRIGEQTLLPSKTQGTAYWFNLPGKTLPNKTHPIELLEADGNTHTSSCTVKTTVYERPVAYQITPMTIQTGAARRILIQGEEMDKTTRVELRGIHNVSLPYEILDTKVISVQTPSDILPGTYHLWIGDTTTTYQMPTEAFIIHPTN